jgi:hypothetical protein
MTHATPPKRMMALPVDRRGFPVPWFAAWVGEEPDFRCVAPGKLEEAIRRSLCWVCGQPLGRFKSFVTGPLCAVNGISAEPPSHKECAEYSARSCPFLTKPRMRRNEKNLPDHAPHPVGSMVERNPGVALVWTTSTFQVMRMGGGALFRVGRPEAVQWFAEGREATRAEVLASIESGLPYLQAEADREGPEAGRALELLATQAMNVLPVEAAGSHEVSDTGGACAVRDSSTCPTRPVPGDGTNARIAGASSLP